MSTLNEIERLTKAHADAREALADRVGAHQAEVKTLVGKNLRGIKHAADKVSETGSALSAAIQQSPDLFDRPRTRIYHGIKVGLQKRRGNVVIEDEEKTIKRARKLLPEDQVELIIRTKESVHKPAVYDLTAADLKRLGIKIEKDADAVVIKSADAEIDRFVQSFLDDAMVEEMDRLEN